MCASEVRFPGKNPNWFFEIMLFLIVKCVCLLFNIVIKSSQKQDKRVTSDHTLHIFQSLCTA